MVFSANPLSLTVPDPAFESWLRDSGYLEILDRPTSSSSSPSPPTTFSTSSSSLSFNFFSHLFTFLSLFTFNPFSTLTTNDFAAETPSWTRRFIGDFASYSFPTGPDQARRRVHENVKRYARNYASLFILFFASTLYQMPLALIGLILCLALWDMFKFCSDKWGWDRYPVIRQVLVHVAQCATAVILLSLNVQMALFCAVAISYAVMVLHAAFRKLTPTTKQPSHRRRI